MKQAQSKVYALLETDAAPHDHRGTIHTTSGMAEPSSRAEPAPPLKVWDQRVDCEARNALQVILSGSEILLDNACRISTFDQKALLERVLASAHHLNNLITTLTRPDELIAEISAECAGPEELYGAGSKRF